MSRSRLRGVHLAFGEAERTNRLYDLTCVNGIVSSVVEHVNMDNSTDPARIVSSNTVDASKALLIPSLCHSHIHLDKCYLLDKSELVVGDFAEALETTNSAKAAFPSNPEDLYQRGKKLIVESLQSGVTLMRAHVEVDKTVQDICLDTAVRLKDEFQLACDVQISVFAQDPLFTSTDSIEPGVNWEILRTATTRPKVEVVGSAPYVEPSTELAKQNILLVLDLAQSHHLHADFHLDYNLDSSSEPLIWFLLHGLRDRVRQGSWKRDRHVCIGHATRLTLWAAEEWKHFAALVAADDLPVSLVGLPQSDIYMMGRTALSPPRATLNPVRLAREHGIRVAMAVNNIGNAFTPQGAPDPLSLCPLGVALFQAGTKKDCQALLESVTVNARAALGTPPANASLVPRVGDPADFVLLHDNRDVQSAACSPSFTRTTIKGGRVVARQERRAWIFIPEDGNMGGGL